MLISASIIFLLFCAERIRQIKGNVDNLQHKNHLGETQRNVSGLSKSAIIHHVQAVERGTASLPCDLSTTKTGDRVVLVVWYKDEHTPIYSYDLRGPHATQAKHWRGENLESRAFFRTMTEPATLSLDGVNEKDEGEYRCRIDYSLSATRNHRVKLSVIVPPQKPTIIDEKGKEVSSVAGPYDEGGDMKLTCIVAGGKPPPSIRWWRSGNLLESVAVSSGFPNTQANQLVIRGLTRSDLHASFTCQASNNNLSLPLQSTTRIEMHFRPLSVEILTSNNPLSAERKYEIPCQTYGSRPAAKIVWLLDGKELKQPKHIYNQTESTNGNVTTSTLLFTPSRHENGLTLTCRAVNQPAKRGAAESTIKLNIFYLPLPTLTLGSSLNPDDIEEGDDVYFDCRVNANPIAYKVLWKHNGRIIQQNVKLGVIISNTNLALQGITRSQMGNYSCMASNVEGDGESNTVNLKIMYKPVCSADQKRVYGVAKHETAKIVCEVESYPPPDRFKWTFNNSAENIDIPRTRYHSETHRFSSTLTYTPITELDYGSVLCWAGNLAGKQAEPCVFHIVTAGKPDSPYNCTISNATSESLEVNCLEGFDGGLPQFCVLEVYDQLTNVIQTNVTNKSPSFLIEGLQAGKLLKIVIYSANSKGRSDAVILEGYTITSAEKQTVLSMGVQSQLEIAPLLGVLVGFVMMMLILSLVTLVYMKMKPCRKKKRGPKGLHRPAFLAVSSKANVPIEGRIDSEDVFEKDEKNPDLIPIYRESEFQHNATGGNHYIQTPQQSVVTPLTEAFLARDRSSDATRDEITYAELALVRPASLDSKKDFSNRGSSRTTDDQTIYAQIDHDRRGIPPSKPSLISPMISPVSSMFPLNKPGIHQKEVVTTRAPLLGYHQESCV